MKNVIIASVVASIAASSAFAAGPIASDTTTWEGKTVNLFEDQCEFVRNEAGKMDYNKADAVWYVEDAAVVEVAAFGVSDITVAPQGLGTGGIEGGALLFNMDANGAPIVPLAGGAPIETKVNYTATTVTGATIDNAATLINVDDTQAHHGFTVSLAANTKSISNVVMNIAGSADMQGHEGVLDNDTNYQIKHVITCVQ